MIYRMARKAPTPRPSIMPKPESESALVAQKQRERARPRRERRTARGPKRQHDRTARRAEASGGRRVRHQPTAESRAKGADDRHGQESGRGGVSGGGTASAPSQLNVRPPG